MCLLDSQPDFRARHDDLNHPRAQRNACCHRRNHAQPLSLQSHLCRRKRQRLLMSREAPHRARCHLRFASGLWLRLRAVLRRDYCGTARVSGHAPKGPGMDLAPWPSAIKAGAVRLSPRRPTVAPASRTSFTNTHYCHSRRRLLRWAERVPCRPPLAAASASVRRSGRGGRSRGQSSNLRD